MQENTAMKIKMETWTAAIKIIFQEIIRMTKVEAHWDVDAFSLYRHW
jgi:hypothetical protein